MSENDSKPLGVDDETLMAYADGELDAPAIAQIEAAVKHDRRLAERVALFRDTAQLAKQGLDELLQEPVPEALQQSVEAAIRNARQASLGEGRRASSESNAGHDAIASADLGTARKPIQPVAQVSWFANLLGAANVPRFALAASVAAFAVGVLGYMLGASVDGPGEGVVTADSGVSATLARTDYRAFTVAMNQTKSGETRNIGDAKRSNELKVVSSFKDQGGTLCREFRMEAATDAIAGVACKNKANWVVTFAANVPQSGSDFSPASADAVMDAYLRSIHATAPLTAEEEMRALSQ